MDNFDLKKYLAEGRLFKEAEEAAITVDSSDIAKIQQAPDVKKLAAAVAKDPKAVAKLDQLMQKAGVTLEESEGVNIDSNDIKKIASIISPQLNEEYKNFGEPDVTAGERMMASFFGGMGAMLIPGALETVNNIIGQGASSPVGGIVAMSVATLLAAVYSLIKDGKLT